MNSFWTYCVQAGALEDVVKASQLEIIELKHTVGELRYMTNNRIKTQLFAIRLV